MPSPAMRLRILPRFPTRVEAVEPVSITRTGGTYTFGLDYLLVAPETAPALSTFTLVQDADGVFYRVALSDLPTGATDWTDIQNRPAPIDGLAALATTLGAVEQTSANTFDIRAIGDASGPSLVTFTQATDLFQAKASILSTISTDGGVATGSLVNDAVTFAKMQNIATARLLGRTTASSGDIEEITVGAGLTLSGGQLSSSATAAVGSVINSTYAEYTTNANLSAAIPQDDTIPQNTEGTQILSASITPSSTSNKVRVRFQAYGASAAANTIIAAAFRGSVANAIQAVASTTAAANFFAPVGFEVEDSPATTSATTYTIRVGVAYLNGSNTSRNFGGASRATLVLEEIKG